MSQGYTVRRINLRNFRQQWYNSLVGWVSDENLAKVFADFRVARNVRREARKTLSRYRWRVSVRPEGMEDVSPKPLLCDIDWTLTNTELGCRYNVSISTIANWRRRAGKPPAPCGGVRPGAGRKPSR